MQGIIGRLGDMLKTDLKYDIPISTIGASSLNKIVVYKKRDAEQAIDYLRKNKLGRGSFYALDSIRNCIGFMK